MFYLAREMDEHRAPRTPPTVEVFRDKLVFHALVPVFVDPATRVHKRCIWADKVLVPKLRAGAYRVFVEECQVGMLEIHPTVVDSEPIPAGTAPAEGGEAVPAGTVPAEGGEAVPAGTVPAEGGEPGPDMPAP
jgi:hypothetical protein